LLLEKELVHGKEKLYFALVVIASVVIYLALLISIVGIIFLAVGIIIYWLLHTYSLTSIRKNGVRLSEYQFPEFYAKATQLANEMGMDKVPNIYVVQSGGLLNAFATKFGFKNMVVLYSDIFALIEEGAEDEVLFILAHEFAHVKRRHIGYSWLLMPGLSIPFLSSAYSRACEFTCDRYGAAYTKSYEGAKNALTILAVGPQLYQKVNKEAFVQQINEENGAFSWIDEITSTHPNLPRRIHAIDTYFNRENAQFVKSNVRGMVTGLLLFVLFCAAVIAGSVVVANKLDDWANELDPFADIDEVGLYNTDSMNDLMLAVMEGNIDDITSLANDSSQLYEVNDEGYTALHLAVLQQNVEALEILLQAGSPTETIDLVYSYTPLMDAVYFNDIASTELLLQYGTSQEVIDAALPLAEENDNIELINLLNNYLE
jgi:Zn-dependent protease with chaperone function